MSNIDQYFMTTDFRKYLGTSLGTLEHDFAIRYQKRTGMTEPPTQLIGVDYTFVSNYSVDVYFSEIKYTHFDSKKNKWDFRKVNKEQISGIKIKHYGSSDYYYCKEFGEVRL